MWTNWTLCHLTDWDLAAFLKRANNHLKEEAPHQCAGTASALSVKEKGQLKTGLLFVKENTAERFQMIKGQYHRVRTISQYEKLFTGASFKILH